MPRAKPKHVVNLEEYGNTSSTTLFVALHKYLAEQRMHKGDRVMLLALASSIVQFGSARGVRISAPPCLVGALRG